MKYLLTALLLGLAIPAFATPAPNIVLMYVDDLGWQDVKCYDIEEPSPMETPNIDALAARGVLFRNGYSPAPTCAPSRCAVMSGNHPARAQKTHVVGGDPPAAPTNALLITPWYSGRMPENELTLAKILRQNGYATGHTGKWHMAKEHFSFPGPLDQGFDFTTHRSGFDARGVQTVMKNRLEGFATADPKDPYRLDAEGFPTDPVTTAAIDFMADNKYKPFFLYYATWLVHTPLQSRSKALLEKYCRKLGVDYPTNPVGWEIEGQKNPYYCAMVETLDHYVGQLVEFLESSDDPRNPGHKLIDNTYIFFTSDNGGMEGGHGEIITDNAPLDKGKMSPKEGGIRVPFLVAGPGIPAVKESDVVVNGLDFYPTILSMAGIEKPADKNLDGADLLPLLTKAPDDASLVRDQHGKTRRDMVWHYPHGGATSFQSAIRSGDFKLLRNYDTFHGRSPETELYRIANTQHGNGERGDLEEAINLAEKMPEKARELNARLTEVLAGMKASFPYWNPDCKFDIPNKAKAPRIIECTANGRVLEATFKEQGAKAARADIIYSTNGGSKEEEWFRMEADPLENGRISATLPQGTTHFFVNLIDENNFMVSYPKPLKKPFGSKNISCFAGSAIAVD